MRFIADCHLGKIAKYLRIFGFDTLYFQSIDDSDIIDIAQEEKRFILTSDKGLYDRAKKITLFIPHGEFETQLKFIFTKLDLASKIDPFKRCIDCNGELLNVPKNEIIDDVALKTKIFHDSFQKCTGCGRIYWEGDHFKKMQLFINRFLKSLENEKDKPQSI
jgi:hypothetical protein